MRLVFQVCVSVVIFSKIWGQDIVFPTDEGTPFISGNIGNPGGQVITERIPVKAPGECPENMLLYPGGGNTSNWICDCKLTFVYFPDKDNCYELYKRGPCPPGQLVILPRGEVIPTCTENPCREEKQVPVNGTCGRIGTVGGICGPEELLHLNVTTYQLECTELDIEGSVIIKAPTKECPPGSRRNSSGHCKIVF